MTPEQLQAVAERMNWDELCVGQFGGYDRIVELEGGGLDTLSDGDLLLAILNRSAWFGPDAYNTILMAIAFDGHKALAQGREPKPLEAAILAFAQLPVKP